MKLWIILNFVVLYSFATEKKYSETIGSDGKSPNACHHLLDKEHAAQMVTMDEIKNLENRELEKRKLYKADPIGGSLGLTEFFESQPGDFLVRKSLKGWSKMRPVDKRNKARQLQHEKEMLQKLQDVDGILKIFSDLSSTDSIVLESMSMDGYTLLEYLVETKKNISNEFLTNFLKLLEPLAKMHERGITHNDIAMENIMYKNGNWKFIDFDRAGVNLNDYPKFGRREFWSPEHQHEFNLAPVLDLFTKFEKVEHKPTDLKKEDVYALGIASLFLIAPRNFGRRIYNEEKYGAFQPLITFLKHESQILRSGKRIFLKDGREFTWEEYHHYLVNFIPEMYDPKLKRLIAMMIHPDSEMRLSAKDASLMLNEISKN